MKVNDGETLLRFEQAVLPHLDAAYNLARWLMRDQHDAEDVVQQACLRACRGFGTFRGGDAKSWLLTIVRNACYTELRRRGRALPREMLDDNVSAPAGAGDPQLALLRRLDHDALASAIDELPAGFREIFVLREMEGLSYNQIADVARAPIGTVMSRLARAHRRLQETLAGRVSAVDEER